MVDALNLNLKDPRNLEPFQVKDIKGLDAGSIMAKYYGQRGGADFFNLSSEPRLLVIRAGVNPDFSGHQSYSNLRDALYRLINASKTGQVKMVLKNGDDVVAAISGFVSKVQTALFEKDQEVELSIKCDDPFFRASDYTTVNVGGFIFTDDVITDHVSTAPHGFSFQLKVTESIPNIYIVDPTDETWNFDVVPLGGFLPEDILYFSNEFNRKQLYIIRDGIVIDMKASVSIDSIWPIIFPGDNHFSFQYPDSMDWLVMTYYKTYWGV